MTRRNVDKLTPVIEAIRAGGRRGARLRQRCFPERYAMKEQGGIVRPDSIAEIYWQIHRQPRDAWTHEMDLRPCMETF